MSIEESASLNTSHGNNYDAVDAFKFIAAVLVVVIHTSPFIEFGYWNYYVTCFCRIAVPFFFTFSSFIFYKRKKSISSYVKRMLVLYAYWFVIELPLVVYSFFIAPDRPFVEKLLIFLRNFFVNSTFPASWFITASWQGMLLVHLLSKKVGWKGLFLIGILCYCSSMPGTMYYELISGTPFYKPYWYGFNIILCPANSFITAVPFIVIGKYLASHKISLPGWKIYLLLFLAFCLAFLEVTRFRASCYMNDTFISLLLISPLLLLVLLNSSIRIPGPVCHLLRKSSILIYLVHLPILFLLQHFWGINNGFSCFTIVLAISMIISFLIILLSKRIPALRNLY